MDVPVSFDHNGIQFDGFLTKVSGGGNQTMYHLMINNYCRGQVFNVSHGWQFASNKAMFEEDFMVEFFTGP